MFQNIVREERSLQFRVGQIFFGKVNRLFNGQHAEISLGSHKLIAKLEVPLVSGEGYWLQVASDEEGVQLKLLEGYSQFPQNTSKVATFIRTLGLRDTKTNQMLGNYLLKEELSLTKAEILTAAKLLSEVSDTGLGLQTIKMMKEKNMPLNEAVFKSFMAVEQEHSTVDLIRHLQRALTIEKDIQRSGQDLLQLIRSWNLESEKQMTLQTEFGRHEALKELKQGITRTGFDYEAKILNGDIQKENFSKALKPLLVRYIQDGSIHSSLQTKEIVGQLLNRMNGFQLHSNEFNQLQTIMYEIPITIGGSIRELTMQWSGKRANDGKLDPNFCHIMFYLELQNLESTIVNMHVQNRIVNITIINDSKTIQTMAGGLIPVLKNGLKDLNYTLSGVHFKETYQEKVQKKKKAYHQTYASSGVDIRI